MMYTAIVLFAAIATSACEPIQAAVSVKFNDPKLESRAFWGGVNVVQSPDQLEVRYPRNESSGGVSAIVEYPQEVYVKHDIKFSKGFDFGQGMKIFRLQSFDASRGMNNWDLITCAQSKGGSKEQCGVTGNASIYAARNAGSFWGTFPFQFETERWYTIQYHVLLNSAPGAANGRYQLWIDGKLMIDVKQLDVVENAVMGPINKITYGGWYSNGAGGNPCPNPEPGPNIYQIKNAYHNNRFIP